MEQTRPATVQDVREHVALVELRLRARVRSMWWAPPALLATAGISLWAAGFCWDAWQEKRELFSLAIVAVNIVNLAVNLRAAALELIQWGAGFFWVAVAKKWLRENQ